MITPKTITSLTNDRVKAIKALEQRKIRKETGLFVAEGTSLLVTAREHGIAPQSLVYQTGAAESGLTRGLVAFALQNGAEVLEVSEAVLLKLSSKDNPQTMLGVFKQRFAPMPNVETMTADQTWVALEEVRDPGNLGTIVRTADAAGAAGVILAGTCCDPYSPEAVRATMGSIFAVPIVKLERRAFLDLVQRWPGDTVATLIDAREDFRRVAYQAPELLVMGGEGPGLSAEAAAACRRSVRIPMAGNLDSLNLSIATALALYQIRGARLKV